MRVYSSIINDGFSSTIDDTVCLYSSIKIVLNTLHVAQRGTLCLLNHKIAIHGEAHVQPC